MADLRKEIEKRRTFAIISHPDAGKTTAGADGTGGTDGISTETGGRETGDPDF